APRAAGSGDAALWPTADPVQALFAEVPFSIEATRGTGAGLVPMEGAASTTVEAATMRIAGRAGAFRALGVGGPGSVAASGCVASMAYSEPARPIANVRLTSAALSGRADGLAERGRAAGRAAA